MTVTTDPHSPIVQAEQARQVVGVLTFLERQYAVGGAWTRGARFGRRGGMCLIGGIDEATEWTIVGVADEAARELVQRLPAPLRLLGRVRPRFALALYNDLVGGRRGALRLVRRTRFELGGVSTVPGLIDPPFTAGSPAVLASPRS